MPTTWLNTTDWQTATLTQNELWQCRDGEILTTLEPVADPEQGILLRAGEVRFFYAGQTVSWRRWEPTNAKRPARLAREANP